MRGHREHLVRFPLWSWAGISTRRTSWERKETYLRTGRPAPCLRLAYNYKSSFNQSG